MKALIEFLLSIFKRKKDRPVVINTESQTEKPSNQRPESEKQDDTFPNPTIDPDPPVGRGERWDLSKKDYDNSWRIRWPTTLSKPPHNIGPGSYCTVNGKVAKWRSYDVDNGAKRPSYTMPQTEEITFPAKCILYNKDNKPVAWFIASGPNTSGRLP